MPSSPAQSVKPASTAVEPEKIPVDIDENQSEKDDVDKQHVRGLKLAILLSILTLVFFLALLDTSIIGTAIPRITSDFHSLPDVGWYIGVYTLASATLQPLSGKLYTHFPNKVVFLGFIFLFELGSLICGVAPSSPVFIVGRAIAGLGVSGISNGALTILSASVDKSKSPLYMGILFGTSQTGIVAGPLIGGALTENATWRWCFYINLPIGGLAVLILTFIHIPENAPKQPFSSQLLRKLAPEFDLLGFVLFIPPSIMFLLALQFGSGNTYPWNSATIIGLFVGSGILAIVFILWERRMGDRAMLPGNLIKQRIVWMSSVYGLCTITCMLVASNWLPTYFQAVRGAGPTLSGVHLLPSILSQLLFAIISGAAVSRMGYYLPWAFGSAVVMAIGNGILSTLSPTTSVGKWIGYQIVVGAGRGAAVQLSLVAIQNAVKPAQLAVATAFLIFFQNFGVSVSIVISNVVFTQHLIKTIPQYAPSLSPQEVLDAGSDAQEVRSLVAGREGELVGVLLAYSESLGNVFYILVAFSCLGVMMSFGMGWVDVRKEEKKATGVNKVQDDKAEAKGPSEA